jgi:hypothetical protein
MNMMTLADIRAVIGRHLTELEHVGASLLSSAEEAGQELESFAATPAGAAAIAAGKDFAASHGIAVSGVETTVEDAVAAARKLQADVEAVQAGGGVVGATGGTGPIGQTGGSASTGATGTTGPDQPAAGTGATS